MSGSDLNLLVALDVLLNEASVAKATGKLRLSPSDDEPKREQEWRGSTISIAPHIGHL